MNIHKFLIQNGYKGPIEDVYKGDAVYYHKKIGDTSHQWIVREWDLSRLRPGIAKGYEVEMIYECKDGVWCRNNFYSLTADELIQKLEGLQNRLYSVVELIGGDKNSCRGTDST